VVTLLSNTTLWLSGGVDRAVEFQIVTFVERSRGNGKERSSQSSIQATEAAQHLPARLAGRRSWTHIDDRFTSVHKTANVLNKLPKSLHPKAKRALQEIWMAEAKKDALAGFDAFVETWGVKYHKAVECLIKDREALRAFYDFPAEHWKHLRTTNVIESSFATIRHRTVKGCLSNKTALAMIFKLAEAAERSWRRLDGHNQLPKLILGVRFADGIEVVRSQAQAAA
jgi:hypothetical protein